MFDAPIGFAFSAGAVAAFNPCGFALLPAYLSVFLADGAARGRAAAVRRALVVSGSVAAGFVVVFGVAGLLISQTAVTVQKYTPWISVLVGLALIPVGVAIVRGWQPKLRLPGRRSRGEIDGTVASMFSFGISYATVSLSCTIPAFLVSVSSTFESDSLLAGLVVFAAYTAGMTTVLGALTVAVATARTGAVDRMRGLLRWVAPVSGVLAILAGAYVAYYGWYEIQLERGGSVPTGPIDAVGDVSGRVTGWVDGLGTPALVGVGIVLVVAVAVPAAFARRSRGAVSNRR
ncbi:MAG: cytochrome c biogenesis CcdA family protein [Sporichthyaceae bacterium]